MIPLSNIHPLTDFKRNTAAFRTRLRSTGRPEVLTIDGRPELVVQSAEAYQRMLQLVEWAEDRQAIEEGIRDAEAGRTQPWAAAMRKLRKKHNIRKRK
jgi:PHD/YefM family antitoxin component YafN of YafNO toxin-antitoxin module